MTADHSEEKECKTPNPEETKGLKFVLRALSYKNYRLYFGGQGISLIGTWMQQVAMSWLVYRLTHSALLLGMVAFISQIPHLFISPFAGVLVDRWNRHRILIITQILSTIQAAILAILVMTNRIQIWHIFPLGLFLGIVNAMDAPTRQSFVVHMVDKKDLSNAIALNSAMFNGARLIGPTLAGIMIAAFGEGLCFLLNAVSFLAVIWALLLMDMPAFHQDKNNTHILPDLKEGARYTFGSPTIRAILIQVSSMSLIGMSYVVLMPIFTKDVLHGGPQTLGMLVAGVGIGALFGALFLASRKETGGLLKMIGVASLIFSGALIAFSFSRWFPLSLGISLFLGFGMMAQMVSCNTVIQTIVDDDKRGRVLSFYTMSFLGISPFGALIMGSLASRLGAPVSTFIGGVCCMLIVLLYLRRLPVLREDVKATLARMAESSERSEANND
jgi:MFS family permease